MQNYIPIFIIIFFLIVTTGGGFLIWPKFQESKMLQNDIKNKKAEIEQTSNYFKELKELKIQLETDYLDELSKINAALPSGFSMPSFLKFLQESTTQSGLLLKSISPSMDNSSKEPDLKELRVSLDVDGSYSAFKNFLSVLENSSRLIEVENISFSSRETLKKPTDKEKALSSFNLQIKAFGY